MRRDPQGGIMDGADLLGKGASWQGGEFPGQEPDREDYLRGIATFHAASSEGRLIIEDQVGGGEKVVTRFVVHSPHDRGELMGVSPTGRVLTDRGIVIHRIVEGKVAEEWGMGTIGSTLRKQRLEQEIRERERVEQELRVARIIQQDTPEANFLHLSTSLGKQCQRSTVTPPLNQHSPRSLVTLRLSTPNKTRLTHVA
jgi:SnoaL-like polyketide cyclase